MWILSLVLSTDFFRSSYAIDFTGTIVIAPGSNFVPPQAPVPQLVGMLKNLSFMLDELLVPAGINMHAFLFTSSEPFFGSQTSASTMTLVSRDVKDCSLISTPMSTSPFDGVTRPLQLSQLSSRWGPVSLARGGNFTFCYGYDGSKSLMSLGLIVYGVQSLGRKVFCRLDTSSDCSGSLDIFGNVTGKVSLIVHAGGRCGVSNLQSAFENETAALDAKSGNVFAFSFGKLLASTSLQSFRICYCPDFEAVSSGNTSCSSSRLNFVQEGGLIILTRISIRDPLSGNFAFIAPRIKFNLEVNCGTGGCSPATSRVKLVDSTSSNKLRGGCSNGLQSSLFLSPRNCQGNATACSLVPLPDSTGNGSKVVFPNLQLDSRLINNVRTETLFDVCFCDSDCWLRSSWIFVDTIRVQPMYASFTVGGVYQSRPTIRTSGSIRISVYDTVPFRLSGSTSREMKLISDNSRTAGSNECLSTVQSPLIVNGHDCYSTTNCESPSFNSSTVMIFGQDDISILQAGWIAVCFCNGECSVSTNWMVVGRLLFSGPSLSQSWIGTTNLDVSLEVRGWGLAVSDKLLVCPPGNSAVIGPLNSTAQLLSGPAITSIMDAVDWDVRFTGTVIRFSSNHGLVSGDRINVASDEPVIVLSSRTILISRPFDSNFRPNTWWRSDKESFGTLIAESQGNYSICWRPSLAGAPLPIGILRITNPPTASGFVGLATIVPGAPAPIVLQFPSSLRIADFMRIVFPSVLEPLDPDGNSFASLTPALSVCGLLFLEMNSAAGFSYPSNCSAGFTPTGRKEIVVRFNSDNGIRVSDTHSFVLMSRASAGLSPVNGFVEVWMMRNDGSVVEVVNLRATRTVSALLTPASPSQISFQIYTDSGEYPIKLTGYCASSCNPCSSDSECPGSTCSSPATYACSKFSSFKISLSGDIVVGSQLRLLFSPFNDWNLQQSIVITSQSSAVVTSTTENIVSETLVGDSGGNILSFTLPSSNSSSWDLSVGSLRLPQNGFLASNIWAEIIPPDVTSHDPVLIRSSAKLYAKPSIKTASFVKPSFVSWERDRHVQVYMKLVLGFIASGGTFITIHMPPGYSCRMPMVAGCDKSRDPQGCGFAGTTSKDLEVFKGVIPSGRGLIGERTEWKEYTEAGWTQEVNACVLSLKTTTRVFSRSSIFLSFLVDNPTQAVQRADLSNVWRVSVSQEGVESINRLISADGSILYVNNFAVAGMLTDVSLSPSSLKAVTETDLVITFVTQSACRGSGGTAAVLVQADVEFTAFCLLTSPGLDFEPVTVGAECTLGRGSGTAIIHALVPIKANSTYTLRMKVKNRETGSFQVQVGTESAEGSVCDQSAIMNGWAVYPHVLNGTAITVGDLRPGVTRSPVRIFPITVPVTSRGGIRITAPDGYIWSFSSFAEFRITPDDVAGVTEALPISALPAAGSRVILIESLSKPLLPGRLYGIETLVSVPSVGPPDTSNNLIVEIGTAAAAIIRANKTTRIRNPRVELKSTIKGDPNNTICMQFEIVTHVARGGRITIEFQSKGFILGLAGCFPQPWGTFKLGHALPKDSLCTFRSDPGVLQIVAGASGIAPGQYRFCIDFRNPNSIDTTDWRIYSKDRSSNRLLDDPVTHAPIQLTEMILGGVLTFPDSVGLWFQVDPSDQSVQTNIKVSPPDGYSFTSDCSVNASLGLQSNAIWPQETLSVACTETSLIMHIASPLHGGWKYAFQILSGLVEPKSVPSWNRWTITVNDKFSTRGLSGSSLAIFKSIKVVPENVANGETNTTVHMMLTPQTTIPTLGKITVTLPLESGFTFPFPCSIWNLGNVKLACTTTRAVPNILNLTIISGFMTGQLKQDIYFTINNPVNATKASTWQLTSFDGSYNQLDGGSVNSYSVVPRIKQWTMLGISSTTGGGLSSIDLLIGFVNSSIPHGLVEAKLPLGYILNHMGSSKCLGASGIGSDFECVGNMVRFKPTSQGGKISLIAYNPVTTPYRNTFVIMQLRGKDLLSFGSFEGPRIIPKLDDCAINFTNDSAMSAGSVSHIKISCSSSGTFDRVRISGKSFNMSSMTASAPIMSRDSESAIFATNWTDGEFSIIMRGIINPIHPGISSWSVRTLAGTTTVSLSDGLNGPEILGRLTINPELSVLTPREFGARRSELVLSLEASVEFESGDYLNITAPPGYTLINGTIFSGFEKMQFSRMRLLVDLPATMEKTQPRNWLVELYSNNDKKLKATNDGLFEGFWLTSPLTSSVVPVTTGPNLRTHLAIRYRIPLDVRMAFQSVALQVAAPQGFVFSSSISCLTNKTDIWTSCSGSGNVATVLASGISVPSGAGMLELIVFNPLSTPMDNTWSLSIYVDDNISLVTNKGSTAGYPVKAMEARFIGTNRMGTKSVGFFVFKLSSVPSTFFQVLIQGPRGYSLICDRTYYVGMQSAPLCSGNSDQLEDTSVGIIVPKSEIGSSTLFTVGLTIKTSTSPVDDDLNFFSLVVQDSHGATIDANTHVPGQSLAQIFVEGLALTASIYKAMQLSEITLEFNVEVPIASSQINASSWLSLKIEAPENFVIGKTINIPQKLKASESGSIQVKGNRVVINLSPDYGIDLGKYTLGLTVMNPGSVPHNNYWMFYILQGGGLFYVMPLEGFLLT